MTVKRRWTTKIPIFGEIRRSITLKPGYTEDIQILHYDEECKSSVKSSRRLRVVSDDEVLLEETEPRTYPVFGFDQATGKIVDLPTVESYKKNEINTSMIKWDYCSEAKILQKNPKAFFDTEAITIAWEPTLSSQSRK